MANSTSYCITQAGVSLRAWFRSNFTCDIKQKDTREREGERERGRQRERESSPPVHINKLHLYNYHHRWNKIKKHLTNPIARAFAALLHHWTPPLHQHTTNTTIAANVLYPYLNIFELVFFGLFLTSCFRCNCPFGFLRTKTQRMVSDVEIT